MPAYPVIVLTGAILLLAAYGAGIFPWTVFTAAFALSLCLRPPASRQPASLPVLLRRLLFSPVALLLGYLLLMLIPMTASISVISGTERARQNHIVAEALEAVSGTGLETGAPFLFSTTRSRAGSLRFLLLIIPMAAGFRIMAAATARQRDLWLHGLLAIAAIAGLAGILGRWFYPQGDTLLWHIPVPHGLPGPMGGFMNRNHFAGFCAILAPAAIALAVEDLCRRRVPAAFFSLSAAAVLSLGVFLALSRGGIAAWAAGLASLLLIGLIRGHTTIRIMTAIAAVLLLAAVTIVALRHDAVRERVTSLRNPASDSSLQTRVEAWRDSMRIWQRYPLLGAGPNAFRTVFPQHRTTSARDVRDFAENEYVQWIAETGIAGILILLLFAAVLARAVIRALRSTPSGPFAPTTAAMAALAAAAVHALADFPMHLPLYAITLASMTGMLWPSGSDTPVPAGPSHRRPVAKAVLPAWQGMAGVAATLLLLGFDTRLDAAGRIASANLPDTAHALAAAPTSPVAWRRLAALLWQENTPETNKLAERCLTQAAAYDPNNYPLWRRLGDMRRQLGDRQGALDAYQRVKALRAWVNVPTTLPEDP